MEPLGRVQSPLPPRRRAKNGVCEMTAERLAILDRVREALRSEPRLGPGVHFHVAIDEQGVLALDGEVLSVAQKKLALERAAAIAGVSGVADRLRVRPAARMGDGEIRAHLRSAFIEEPSFLALEISESRGGREERLRGAPDRKLGRIVYEVNGGVVTLNGETPGLTSKRLAGVLAWWIPGVRDVINGLSVEPDEPDSPDLMEEAVRVVLEKDPFVNAGQVRVGVRGRTVRLTGLAPKAAERDMAERDAWCVFGVDQVINEIEIAP
jgi:osmotically-inducible protein OsmY